jgi:hypothetical protein
MTQKGFIFLLLCTIVTVAIAATLLEPYTVKGMERTLWVAFATAVVLFPLGKVAEKLGWVTGGWDPANLRAPKPESKAPIPAAAVSAPASIEQSADVAASSKDNSKASNKPHGE